MKLPRKKKILKFILLLSFLFIVAFNELLRLPSRSREINDKRISVANINFTDLKFNYKQNVVVGNDIVDQQYKITVAIGLSITSKKVTNITKFNIVESFQFFYTFLPSFCKTASDGFDYSFYLAYDFSDNLYKNVTFRKWFAEAFREIISVKCSSNLTASLYFVRCDHEHKPAWAQNDAMLEAYLDNADYYFRINDDTLIITKNWTWEFISALGEYTPKNIGVVGPAHSGGHEGILTYDFVHRIHIDILGYYYPRMMTDWWGDNWITMLYTPERRRKLYQVRLFHTEHLGTRYEVNPKVGQTWRVQLNKDKSVLMRYIQYLNTTATQPKSATWGRNVISMSLFGNDPRYTWGAIRNAQLAPIFFPVWKLRFYVIHPAVSDSNLKEHTVSLRILRKLHQLGAQIELVPESTAKSLPAQYWRYLIINDTDVDYFLIRDANSRLSERESVFVEEWLSEVKNSVKESPALHYIRDHARHIHLSVVEGLWGGDANKIRSSLSVKNTSDISTEIQNFLRAKSNKTLLDSTMKGSDDSFVEALWQKLNLSSMYHDSVPCKEDSFVNKLWQILNPFTKHHDSVSCKVRPNSFSIRVKPSKQEYIGQKYDEHHENVSTILA